MTKEQFISLLRSPATINLNMVSDLEEITERFPYFTNAHLLLARQYFGHENIKYESYLKKASVYSPDRSILFRLIHTPTDQVIHIEKSQKEEVPVVDLVHEFAGNQGEDISMTEIPTEDTFEESTTVTAEIPVENIAIEIEQKQQPEITETPVQDTKEKLSPQEIIEQRLRELSGTTTTERGKTEVDKSEPPIKNEPIEAKEEIFTRPAEPSKTEIKELKSEPYKRVEAPEKTGEAHSFIEWLHMKSVPVIPVEQVNETILQKELENPDNELYVTKKGGEIIEKFIKNEPRIVPSRSEFYSPGNMARNSLVEHDDLVSETLATIYARQGNPRKAIETYQKLMLKFPEKSSYFAARIRELEEGTI